MLTLVHVVFSPRTNPATVAVCVTSCPCTLARIVLCTLSLQKPFTVIVSPTIGTWGSAGGQNAELPGHCAAGGPLRHVKVLGRNAYLQITFAVVTLKQKLRPLLQVASGVPAAE
jgi:hypothetical protein